MLRLHLMAVRLPHALALNAYAASEDLRASPPVATDWQQFQAQVIRVVPIVQRLVRTLATPPNAT